METFLVKILSKLDISTSHAELKLKKPILYSSVTTLTPERKRKPIPPLWRSGTFLSSVITFNCNLFFYKRRLNSGFSNGVAGGL